MSKTDQLMILRKLAKCPRVRGFGVVKWVARNRKIAVPHSAAGEAKLLAPLRGLISRGLAKVVHGHGRPPASRDYAITDAGRDILVGDPDPE